MAFIINQFRGRVSRCPKDTNLCTGIGCSLVIVAFMQKIWTPFALLSCITATY